MRRWIGRWLMGVGMFHLVMGFLLFPAALHEFGAVGPWNFLGDREPSRYLLFWFMIAGVLAVALGYLADWIERVVGRALPRSLGWVLLTIALIGVIMAPVSGFWLLFPPAAGILIWRRAGMLPA